MVGSGVGIATAGGRAPGPPPPGAGTGIGTVGPPPPLGPGAPGRAMPGAPAFAATTLFPNHGDILHDHYGGLRFAREMDDDGGGGEYDGGADPLAPLEIVPWRMRERMKTMDVALVLCLNIGTDPPDVVKASPCARKECWVDPFSMPAQKALETIGKTLQSQYERWQPRARYRQSLDPTVDEIKQLSVSLRRHAKHDRVLFHYNGHGVPRPTANGEIWVFNKSYTQYIPLLVYDLQSWIGTPSIYVFDCSAAGILLSHFTHGGASGGAAGPGGGDASGGDVAPSSGEAIVLAACAANEILPMNPELCADVFTSCLTTPITVALRWFIAQNEMSMAHLDASFIERIPGKLTDRKTPLGELNWIFTAITDTIAWNVLPRELFQKLFRQDLLVASLFRNFLLAERIMKSAGCSPCSLPALPPTHHHPLWRSWDLAAEICLNQLYKISNPHPFQEVSFQPSRFFAEQLTAFEVWLQFGSPAKSPPQQLPMVLQVLLSQVHRLRALVLLKKFLDLGPWAVNLALSVGIFPYVLKLLQSPASELRQVLVFIWAKILALDPSCQLDLVKDEGHSYFITHLASGMSQPSVGQQGHGSSYGSGGGGGPASTLPAEQKIMAGFILSVICNGCPQGQKSCIQQYLHKICGNLLVDSNDDVRKWMCLCLAKLWEGYEDAKRVAIDDKLPRLLSARLHDDRPDVRAAAAYALGALVGLQFDGSLYGPNTDSAYVDEFLRQRAHNDIVIASELLWGCKDAAPLVRKESVMAIANVVLHTYHQPRFQHVAQHLKNHPVTKRSTAPNTSMPPVSGQSQIDSRISSNREIVGGVDNADQSFPVGVDLEIDPQLVEKLGEAAKYYIHIWHTLKEMQLRDPFPRVVAAVKGIVSRVNSAILSGDHEPPRSQGNQLQTSSNPEELKRADQSLNTIPRNATMNGGFVRETSTPTLPGKLAQHHQSMRSTSQESHVVTSDARTQAKVPVAGSSGGMMRPTQSVGNFRAQYQDEYRSTPATAHQGPGVPTRQMRADQPLSRHATDHSWQTDASTRPVATPQPKSLLPSHGRQPDFPHPLKSRFYEKQKKRFSEPILEPNSDNDDPLSERGAEKLERRRRYEQIRKMALKIAPGFSSPSSDTLMNHMAQPGYSGGLPPMSPVPSYSSSASLSSSYSSAPRVGIHADRDEVKNFTMTLRQRAVLNTDAEMTSLLLFHPYETLLIVADEKDQISLYNFEQSEKKVLMFGNRNPSGSRLTSLTWINETEESLLTCGSDDGVIRVYQGLHTPHPMLNAPRLLTSFLAVPDLVPGTRGSGLITNWQQHAGMLYTGGNSGTLRGWNLRQERCTFALPTQTDSCITTLASDETSGGTIVAGFGDGSLRLFDTRCRPELATKCTMKEHTSWVVQTHVYAGKNEMLSGSVSGELKFWDLRYPKNSVRSLEAHRSPMTALAVHDYAPVFASGSHNQFIKVFRSDGEQLALIRYHEGFLGERIGPVSCLAFHPHRLYLAAGATDSVVAIYSSDK